MAPTRTPRRPPLGEVSTNTPGKAPIEKTPENITRPGPKRKTKEQRSTTWVDPGKPKKAYHANANSVKEKYIMYHHTARVEHWDQTLQQNVMEQPYYREVYEHYRPKQGKYNVSFSTMCRWLNDSNSARIMVAKTNTRKQRFFWSPWYPLLEEKLVEAFREYRQNRKLVRRRWFRKNAIKLFQELYGTKTFVFSNGWFEGFLKRAGITLRRVTKKVKIHTKLFYGRN
jgi:hypothetical protein